MPAPAARPPVPQPGIPPGGMPTPPAAPNPSTAAPTATPAPAPKEPAPTFAGSIRIATFSDNIATGGKAEGSKIDMGKVEAALKRVEGVSSVTFDPNTREINVGFSGPCADIKKVKIAVDGQGLPAEILNPARVVVRPMGQLEDASKALSALKGVGGVSAAEKEFNDLIAYADLSTVSLDSLQKAVEGSGTKCQIVSHEEIKVKFSASGQAEDLKTDLSHTKWVLKAEIDSADSSVKVLAVKGRVTRAIIKSVMAKHGFPEAK